MYGFEEILNEPVPDRLYKFLHKKDLHFWTNDEVLRLASNRFYAIAYAKMEIKNPAINDPTEGSVVWYQDRAFTVGADGVSKDEMMGASLVSRVFGLGSHSPAGGHFEGNVVRISDPMFHMICFTTAHPAHSQKVFCNPANFDGSPYDACLEIVDPLSMIQSIYKTGMVKA